MRLEAGHACPRYVCRIIRNVAVGAETPLWMRERLRRSGLRSLGPVVDVTNYVLLELGQPMHAFDLARLDGEIRVRLAAARGAPGPAQWGRDRAAPRYPGHRRRPGPRGPGRDHGRRLVRGGGGHPRHPPGERLLRPRHRRRQGPQLWAAYRLVPPLRARGRSRTPGPRPGARHPAAARHRRRRARPRGGGPEPGGPAQAQGPGPAPHQGRSDPRAAPGGCRRSRTS